MYHIAHTGPPHAGTLGNVKTNVLLGAAINIAGRTDTSADAGASATTFAT